MADVSHRLRTPMTALRIDAESLHDHVERAQMLVDVDALEGTVDEVIVAARRPARIGLVTCDAVAVVAERTAFWRPLAEDTDRAMTVELADGELPVRVTSDDLKNCMDVLLENVFSHTPDGVALAVRLSRRAAGGAWLVVSDDGPGFADTEPGRAGQLHRRLHRARPGHRPPDRGSLRWHADHRPLGLRRRGGDPGPGRGHQARGPDESRHRRTRSGEPAAPSPRPTSGSKVSRTDIR